MSNLKPKRAHLETIGEILNLCRKPTAVTRIIHKTNTSYAAMQQLLTQLQKTKLLKLDNDTKKYETTEKGLEYIKRYLTLQELLKQKQHHAT